MTPCIPSNEIACRAFNRTGRFDGNAIGDADDCAATNPSPPSPPDNLAVNVNTRSTPVAGDDLRGRHPLAANGMIPSGTFDNKPDEFTTPTAPMLRQTATGSGPGDGKVRAAMRGMADRWPACGAPSTLAVRPLPPSSRRRLPRVHVPQSG